MASTMARSHRVARSSSRKGGSTPWRSGRQRSIITPRGIPQFRRSTRCCFSATGGIDRQGHGDCASSGRAHQRSPLRSCASSIRGSVRRSRGLWYEGGLAPDGVEPASPGERRPGTVGRQTGIEIAISDDQGALLPAYERGEVVIRGPSIIDRYANNPDANARSFTNGWFGTGDQGVVDRDGYLSLIGRLKEMINRGGEKIAPREIDEVLLQHPAVAEAVAFGSPHPVWGEEVAAAVVLKEDVSEKELIAFVRERLVAYKVPRRLFIVRTSRARRPARSSAASWPRRSTCDDSRDRRRRRHRRATGRASRAGGRRRDPDRARRAFTRPPCTRNHSQRARRGHPGRAGRHGRPERYPQSRCRLSHPEVPRDSGARPNDGDSLKHDALVVGAMNGIPWWYFRDRHLDPVDPGGVIAGSIPYEQVIGSVVYPAATLVAPGVVEHEEGERFTLGEPDGSKSDRVQALARLLSAAGFKAPVQTRIRNEIWLKVVGNATLNPLSAITRATMGEIFAAEDSRRLVQTLMQEVARVARAHDIELPLSIEKRMEGAAAMGGHKTSMLQDIEAGKRLETDALLGAVIELAEAKEIDVPSLRELYVLTKLAEAVALAKG